MERQLLCSFTILDYGGAIFTYAADGRGRTRVSSN